MSSPLAASDPRTTTAPSPAADPRTLGRLYAARFVFAVAWAALLATTASSLGALTVVLLVVYPVVDVAAAVVDGRSSRRWPAALRVNVAVSAVAAVGVAVASASDLGAVLRVWGAWAVVAGVVQLVVGLSRRTLGGQWPMVLAGGISVLAGAGFVASAARATSLGGLAGYAVLGGVFFLVSAVRLRRSPARPAAER